MGTVPLLIFMTCQQILGLLTLFQLVQEMNLQQQRLEQQWLSLQVVLLVPYFQIELIFIILHILVGQMSDLVPFCDKIDIYDSSTNSWTTSALSVGRHSLVGVSIDCAVQIVMFAGGEISSGVMTNSVGIMSQIIVGLFLLLDLELELLLLVTKHFLLWI